MNRRSAGQKGELLAVNLLKKNGYRILEKNFNSRFGEIDIVALDGETLVFVEVKARGNRRFGLPEESIRPHKIRSITKTGQYFRLQHKNLPEVERIDVVAIEFDQFGKVTRKEHIKNASG